MYKIVIFHAVCGRVYMVNACSLLRAQCCPDLTRLICLCLHVCYIEDHAFLVIFIFHDCDNITWLMLTFMLCYVSEVHVFVFNLLLNMFNLQSGDISCRLLPWW